MNDLILIKGQRYKEFHYINKNGMYYVDDRPCMEFYMFFVDEILLEIVYMNYMFVNHKRVTAINQLNEDDEIYCPIDIHGSSCIVGKLNKELFLSYECAEKELKKLKKEKIKEIDTGKKWKFLKGK